MSKSGGFTLIEIVVAIFVFSVGALGMAGATAAILRSLGESGGRERAGRIAASRIEKLRGLSCASARGGAETTQGARSTWTVTTSGAAEILVTETVTYSVAGASPSDTYSAILPCFP